MDIDLENGSKNEAASSDYTIIQRFVGLAAGCLTIYSFSIPFVRIKTTFSLEFLGNNVAQYFGAHRWSGSLSLGEYVGFLSYAYPFEGHLILFLTGGAATLTIAGAFTNKLMTAAGGIMAICGAGLISFTLSSTTMKWFGGVAELGIALEPVFGIGLLGGSGLIALLSLRL